MTPRPRSARDVALDALLRIEDGAFAHVAVPALLRTSSLAAPDRAFVTELVYGTVRARRRLDDRLGRVSSRPVDRLDPAVRAGLRLGARQLEIGVAPHAAVSETVDAIARRAPRARGFANACLRAISRTPTTDPAAAARGDRTVTEIGIAESYPDWIVAVFVAEFGARRAQAMLAMGNEAASVTLRPARHRVRPSILAAELRSLPGVTVEVGSVVPDAFVVRGIGDPARLAAVRDGRATPQDQGSQAVARVLDPSPGDRVLDLAAAPGGKAGAIAEFLGSDGLVLALDRHAGRLALVRRHARRLGLGDRMVGVVADGRCAPVVDGTFDRVLVDAPCSGLGVFRRRPDARWRIRPEAIPDLVELQRALVRDALRAVRPGGRVLYSVCTLTPEETRGLEEWLAEEFPAVEMLAAPGEPWEPYGRGARLLPDRTGTDGMYVLVLQAPGPGGDQT